MSDYDDQKYVPVEKVGGVEYLNLLENRRVCESLIQQILDSATDHRTDNDCDHETCIGVDAMAMLDSIAASESGGIWTNMIVATLVGRCVDLTRRKASKK